MFRPAGGTGSRFLWVPSLALAVVELPPNRHRSRLSALPPFLFIANPKIDPNNPSLPFLADSTAIALYLDARYPSLPALGADSPSALFVLSWLPQVHQLVTRLCFDDLCQAMDADCREWYYSAERGQLYGRKDGSGIPNLQVSEAERPGVIRKLRQTLEPARMVLRAHAFLGGAGALCGFLPKAGWGSFIWVMHMLTDPPLSTRRS